MDEFTINLLNIQGLTQVKMVEIEDFIKNKESCNIFCLTETQLKRNHIKTSPNVNYIHRMRKLNDKKGGGLSIIWKNNEKVFIEELENTHPDILLAKCRIKNKNFYILLVYLSTKRA